MQTRNMRGTPARQPLSLYFRPLSVSKQG